MLRGGRWLKVVGAVAVAALALGSSCDDPLPVPGYGSLQLFFDMNVEGLDAAGLGELASVEVWTDHIGAKIHSDVWTGPEFLLDPVPGRFVFPAETRFTVGPLYQAPPGYITQLRIYPTAIILWFTDGSRMEARLPSGEQTGWKVVVDESEYPDGYLVEADKVTGIKLLLRPAELFHSNALGWQARPTMPSVQYNIAAGEGYEADAIVAVFNPATPPERVADILSARGLSVEFAYPAPPPLLFKLHLPPAMDLRTAHSYLRSFSEVLAAAPSARVFERLAPTEGTPFALAPLGAESGWENLFTATGSVGSPATVVAMVSTGGFDIEHPDLYPNLWLNQDELLGICGDVPTCDVDHDGYIMLNDFNSSDFPPALRPPDVAGDGLTTCADLLGPESQYLNGLDDPEPSGNGFVDDLCGWNFVDGTPYVAGSSIDHDTGAAGIMVAAANNGPVGSGVGVCWSCRLMALLATEVAPPTAGTLEGRTAEVLAALVYARQNGAHVANLSFGISMAPDSGAPSCPGQWLVKVDRKAYSTVLDEMDAAVTSIFEDIARPTTLYVLAGGECQPGLDEGLVSFYDWPGEAFASGVNSSHVSMLVAGLWNTETDRGGIAPGSNFGVPFDIAAPGFWPVLLDGHGGFDNWGFGTSFAAPTVAGVAALVVSGDLATYSVPDAVLLKQEILTLHSDVDPRLDGIIPESKAITMVHLP